MRDDARPVPPYDPPSIEDRTPLDVPLIQTVSGLPGTGSAVFRSVPPEPYAAPCIEARDPVDFPLIGQISGVAGFSAVFRTDQIAEE